MARSKTVVAFSLLIFYMFVTRIITEKIPSTYMSSQLSSCGNWVQYGNEKCLHIVDIATIQTKQEAKSICQSLAEIMELDDIPRLVTVRTKEEQKIVQKYLFEEIGIFEPVWLGLSLEDDGVFRWNNGAEMDFANLANQNVSDADRPCLQMESGNGVHPIGQWFKVNCRKRNVVVCEKTQVWTVATLQNNFLNLKSKFEKQQTGMQIGTHLSRNIPVPIGFIYVQLPGKDAPTKLWPETKWQDVGSEYAGLFFRVEGGDAAAFGTLQQDNTRRLAKAFYGLGSVMTPTGDPEIPADGSWSIYAETGRDGTGDLYGIRFRLSKGEVRPKNKAVKIWQRIN